MIKVESNHWINPDNVTNVRYRSDLKTLRFCFVDARAETLENISEERANQIIASMSKIISPYL